MGGYSVSDVKEAIVVVGYVYHFPPDDIWAMSLEDLFFWLNGINWIKSKQGNG